MHRVRRLLDAARALRDPAHPLGREARRTLPSATGLSSENVDWALHNALEVDAREADLAWLCARTPTCGRSHVLLSANVFVAALRAIAIGIASAPSVCVRPSRRESQMVQLLCRAAVGQFQCVEALEPGPGDHCWAYGTDATMAELSRAWPRGVTLHAHGHGYGVVVFESSDLRNAVEIESLADALALDAAAFDQRGCLSPRVILVEKSFEGAQLLSRALAAAMIRREARVPIGILTHEERADIGRHHDTLCMVGEALKAGSGLVTLETEPLPWLLPPTGRVLHIRTIPDAIEDLEPRATELTTIAVSTANATIGSRLARAFPSARLSLVGQMQVPALDGPVDLRHLAGQVL